MGKGPCPLGHFCTARMDGPVDVMDSSGLLAIYYKRRGGVPSVAVWGKAQLYLLSSCAPQPRKKDSSLLQGTGTMQAGAVQQHNLQLATRKSSWVLDREIRVCELSCLAELSWPSLQGSHAQTPGAAVL